MTIERVTPGLLEAEACWAPEPHKPPRHAHPGQDERFELREGELTVELPGRRVVLRAGDALDIPRGTPHRMWNSGTGTAMPALLERPALALLAGVFRLRHGSRGAAAAAPQTSES